MYRIPPKEELFKKLNDLVSGSLLDTLVSQLAGKSIYETELALTIVAAINPEDTSYSEIFYAAARHLQKEIIGMAINARLKKMMAKKPNVIANTLK